MNDEEMVPGEVEKVLAEAGEDGELVFNISADNELLVCPICQEVIGSSSQWSGCKDVLSLNSRPTAIKPGVVAVKVDYLAECGHGGFELWLGFPNELFAEVEDPVATVVEMLRKAEDKAAR